MSRFPVYERLLQLYPEQYRKKYGGQMIQTLGDMLDDPGNSKLSVWTRTTIDFPVSVTKQNLLYAGGVMTHETPDYIKRNSAIASGLLLPFFLLILANSLSGHALDFANSWKALFVWLLVGLPALALLLSAATFIVWANQRKSLWKSLFDVRRNWLMLAPGALALLIVLFVPFHDSSRCMNGNPVRELNHWQETWRCVQRNG